MGLTGLAIFLVLDPNARFVVELIAGAPDKIAHIFIAASLTLTGLLAFPGIKARWIFLVMIILSIGVEVVQVFIGRSAHFIDLLSSFIGITAIGFAFSSAWFRKDQVQQ